MAVRNFPNWTDWSAQHPGATYQDWVDANRAYFGMAVDGTSIVLAPQFVQATPQPTGPSEPIGAGIPVIGAILAGIFGSTPQRALDAFQVKIGQMFPDPDSPVCGTVIPVPEWNGGTDANINIPCSDPQFGSNFRARDLDNLIVFYGILQVMKVLAPFITAKPFQSGGTQNGTNSAEDTIINNVTVVDQSAQRAIENVDNSVTRGIQNTINGIEAIQLATTAHIADSLTSFTNGIEAFTNNTAGAIGNALANAINKLFDPTSILQTALESDIKSISDVVSGIDGEIVGPLGKAIGDLDTVFSGFPQDIGIQLDKVFSPLFDSLKKVWDAIASGDINEISKIAHVLFEFFTTNQHSLADIARDIERIGVIFPGSVHSTIDWDDIKEIGSQLKNLGAELAGVAGHTLGEVFAPSDHITEKCDLTNFDEARSQAKKVVDEGSDWLKSIVHGLFYILMELVVIEPLAEKARELDIERLNHNCPITKIDPGKVVELWSRGILAESDAREELISQGYNKSRQNLLYDGTHFQPDSGTLIDHWFRSIISADVLSQGLKALGYDDTQIEALKMGSIKLLDPSLLLQLWQRNLITEAEIRQALNVQRYDNAQIDGILSSGFRPPNVAESIRGDAIRKVLGNFWLPFISDFDTIPQEVKDAGRAEGMNDDTIRQQWWAHWNILDPATWINLYYRGHRSATELSAALDGFFIPPTLQLDLIDANRPLIPFRTLPTMLASGDITEEQARKKLQQHGFAAEDIDLLIKYAERSKAKATAATPTAVKTLSIQNARTLFDDGAITQEQYVSILEAHGYTAALAAQQAQVDQIAAHAKERKQQLTDLESEVEVGTTTVDAAISQLAGAGFTAAEIARFQNAVRRTATKNTKHPSFPEMVHFFKAGLVTADMIKSELQVQGWLEPWLSAFMGLVTTPTAVPAPAPPSVP